MSQQYSNILTKIVGKLQIITFNNVKRHNAMNQLFYKEVTSVLNDAANNSSIGAVALTNNGHVYSTGNDTTIIGSGTDIASQVSIPILRDFFYAFIDFPKLLFAVVNGPAIGGACTSTGLCDIVYASNKTYFQTPFVPLGVCAEGCSTYTFPKLLGKVKANEMILLGQRMTADEALRLNFISEIFAPEELDEKIWPKIQKFANLPPEAIQVNKRMIIDHDRKILKETCDVELDELKRRLSSKEGIDCMMKFLNSQKGK